MALPQIQRADSKNEIEKFTEYLETAFVDQGILNDLMHLKKSGRSSAGSHSIEELFTREYLCPAISKYFTDKIDSKLALSNIEIEKGLGTEGFQKCPGFSFTPARRQAHFFTKNDVIKSKPPLAWFKSSEKNLSKFQACPDFAIREPLPFNAIGEVKFFNNRLITSAIDELYNATRQAVFYLGAFRGEYDNAILVFVDATPARTFKEALKELRPELLERYGCETGVYLCVIGLTSMEPSK